MPVAKKSLDNLVKWKPGQSGNPGGRPKRKTLTDAYRDALEELNDKGDLTAAEAIARSLVNQAIFKSDAYVARELREATEGKKPSHELPALKISIEHIGGNKDQASTQTVATVEVVG